MARPVYFVEPQVASKRKGVIDNLFGKSKLSADELKEQLLALRKRSLKNRNKNLKTFKRRIEENRNLTLKIVRSPSEAVRYITDQSKSLGITRVDMNKSNTLRGLEPELMKKGFETIHSYNYATESGNIGIFENLKLGNYWDLRGLELENNFQSFHMNPKPLSYSRQLINRATSNQDFIGLLGANVFCTTGEIFTVQHLYNISSILSHAKQTFIVLTLDKLVNSYDDALFQARCTAMYGLEPVILDLFDTQRSKPRSKKQTKRMIKGKATSEGDYENYLLPENLNIILLDDTRMNLVGSKQEDLLYCISCRRCGLYCPRVRAGQQISSTEKKINQEVKLTARELLMDGFLNGPEYAIEAGLFDCTLCRSCTLTCPLDIELTEHLEELRQRCQKADLFSGPHKRIRNNILEIGNAYGGEHTVRTKTGGSK